MAATWTQEVEEFMERQIDSNITITQINANMEEVELVGDYRRVAKYFSEKGFSGDVMCQNALSFYRDGYSLQDRISVAWEGSHGQEKVFVYIPKNNLQSDEIKKDLARLTV